MDFLPSAPVLLAFTIAAAVLIVTPGPDMTLSLGRTISRGRRAGLAAMAGATTGIVVHTGLAAFGVSAILAASATAFTVLKVAGALYLLWLAVDAIRNGSALRLDRDAGRPEPLYRTYLTGLAINLLNPKVILFFITFLPQFVAADDPHARARLIFLGLYFIVLAVPSIAAMIFAAERIARLVRRSPLVTRAIDWLFAGVFASFAVAILAERGRG